MMNKMKKILCIVGKSGSGKSISAEYIKKQYNINMVQSLTDRKPRYKGENGHTFISHKAFDNINKDDMIAYTKFGDNRYCCRHQDLVQNNTYIIDPTGLKYLKETYCGLYDITSVYIHRLDELKKIDSDRLLRDKDKYFLPEDYYNHNINNNKNYSDLFTRLDQIITEVFK